MRKQSLAISVLLVLLLLLFPSFIVAQSFLVDSYDDQIPGSEDEMWHLAEFQEKLLKQAGAKAYIIAYVSREDPPGKANRYALRAKRWLVEVHGVDPARIVTLDGGRRKSFIVELWIAPRDAQPPVPKPDFEVPIDLTDNYLYDEFSFGYDNFAGRTENEAIRLGGFVAALKKEPRSWGCVIAYAQAGNDQTGMGWDQPGDALQLARNQKRYLTRLGLPANRITAVDGGYATRTVELWIMRPGARFEKGPILSPNRLRATGRHQLTINPNPPSSNTCCRACMRQSKTPK